MNKNLELKVPPPVVFSVFAGLMWLLSRAIPTAELDVPAHKALAAGTAALAGIFGTAGILSIFRAKTTINPHDPRKSSSLVTTGVYSVTRNPMYLSLLLVLLGWSIYLSNLVSFVLLPLFIAYLNRFQIKPEEQVLASLFRSEFEAYCKRVRRWL